MMKIVAEMMIFANAAVGQRIHAAFPRAALLRRHPPPRREAFTEVRVCVPCSAPVVCSPLWLHRDVYACMVHSVHVSTGLYVLPFGSHRSSPCIQASLPPTPRPTRLAPNRWLHCASPSAALWSLKPAPPPWLPPWQPLPQQRRQRWPR